MNKIDRKSLIKEKCHKTFRFGKTTYISSEKVIIPFKASCVNELGKTDEYVGTFNTYIVKGDVPWLFGLSSFAEFNAKLDVVRKKLEIKNNTKENKIVKIILTQPLRHLTINLLPMDEMTMNESVNYLAMIETKQITCECNKEKCEESILFNELANMEGLTKLHVKLGHKQRKNMIHALVNADKLTVDTNKMISEII